MLYEVSGANRLSVCDFILVVSTVIMSLPCIVSQILPLV